MHILVGEGKPFITKRNKIFANFKENVSFTIKEKFEIQCVKINKSQDFVFWTLRILEGG